MTKEILEQQKAELESNLETTKATLYRIDGALQMVNRFLAIVNEPVVVTNEVS